MEGVAAEVARVPTTMVSERVDAVARERVAAAMKKEIMMEGMDPQRRRQCERGPQRRPGRTALWRRNQQTGGTGKEW